MRKILKYSLLLILVVATSCNRKGCTDSKATNYDKNATENDGSCKFDPINIPNDYNVKGFGLLEKISGIWDGPVSSPTALGSFPLWIVDFRPISASQVSAKNELDKDNDIFMSFFICKIDDEFKMAFRNGGLFAGYIRNSYMTIDSVKENSSYSFYRFVDPISGGNRVYTDVTFKGDSLIMHTYTNKFNTLTSPVTHMKWTAKIKDRTSAIPAINHFNFPKEETTIDFSTTFDGITEAVFYSTAEDPYPENEQPYLGIVNIHVDITNPSTIDNSKKIMLSITSKPLFNNYVFNTTSLNFRSRYVFVSASDPNFKFNYMHPGTYYLNAIYDINGNYLLSTGDYMNGSFDKEFILTDKAEIDVNIEIDFLIP